MIPGRVRYTGPDVETSHALYVRAGGRCEICNGDLTTGREYSKHHRLPRGRGGRNALVNLMLLCGSGTTGCHGMVERHRAIAYGNGWLVRTGHDPAGVRVLIHGGHFGDLWARFVTLTDDGQYVDVEVRR